MRANQYLHGPTSRRPEAGTPCGYCYEREATVYDHMIPRSFGGTNDLSNLMPSCQPCNGLLGDKVFDSIQARREFVRARRAGEPPVFPFVEHVLRPLLESSLLTIPIAWQAPPRREKPKRPRAPKTDDAPDRPLLAGNGWGVDPPARPEPKRLPAHFGAPVQPGPIEVVRSRVVGSLWQLTKRQILANGSWVIWHEFVDMPAAAAGQVG